jgi:sarcosine oxidase
MNNVPKGTSMQPIDRRAFIRTTGLGGAVAALGSAAPAVAQSRPDVVVIGAGAFGAWTALHLRERGVRVTLLDAFGPGSSRATSGGETRQIRVGYGDREMYSRWVLKAFDRWRAREKEFGRRLLYPSGRLQLGSEWNANMEATTKVFDRLRVKYERILADDLQRRFPAMAFDGVGAALLEPGAAIIKAREAIASVAEAFQRKGGTLAIARAMPGPASGRRMESVVSVGPADGAGRRFGAGNFVFACGPWLRKIFPELLGERIATPRREVFFFGTPPGDERFTWPNLPNFSEETFYGFPSLDGRGLKVSPVGGDRIMDPDTEERTPSPELVARSHEYIATRFPSMKGQPILESRVCQLENTADEHFLIDRHPDYDNVWIAGGGSGHGFKHGPVVGDYIADAVLGKRTDPALARPFALKRATA